MSQKLRTVPFCAMFALFWSANGWADHIPIRRVPADYHILAQSAATLKDYRLLSEGCNVGTNRCAVSSGDGVNGSGIVFADMTQIVGDRLVVGGVNPGTMYQAFCNDCSLDRSTIRHPGNPGDPNFPAEGFVCPILADGAVDTFIAACNELAGDDFPVTFEMNDMDVTVLAGGSDCQFACTGPVCPPSFDPNPGNGVCDLPAGTYGDVAVRNDAKIHFLGGVYDLASYQNGKRVTMSFGGQTTLNVAETAEMRFGDEVIVVAGCGTLRVNFEGGRSRDFGVSFGKDGLITLDLCAPFGFIRLGNSNFIGGHIFGNTISSDLGNQGFCCEQPPTPTPTPTPTRTPEPTPTPTPAIPCDDMWCRMHPPKIRFAPQPEMDNLKLSGLHVPLSETADLAATGLVIVLSDSDGEIYRGTIPPGKISGSGRRWKFRDPAGRYDGIKSLTFKPHGGMYKVRGRIQPALAPGMTGVLRNADREVLTLTLFAGEQCFSTTNYWTMPPPPISGDKRIRKCGEQVPGP